ncbi:MAG TPA: histidine kinase [Gaiellaceae bacterium]
MNRVFRNRPYDEEREIHGAAFGAAPGRSDLVVGLAAVAAVAVVAVVAEGGAASDPAAFTAVLAANVATFVVAGLLWRNSRPSSLIGPLLLVEGLLVAVSALAGSRGPVPHLVGVIAGWAATLGVAWLVVAFPRARPRGAAWGVLSLASAAFVCGELPLLLTSSRIPLGVPVGECAGACPTNPVWLVHSPGAERMLVHVEAMLEALSAASLVAYMVLHFMQSSRPRRRTLALLYGAMVPLAITFAVTSIVSGVAGAHVGSAGQAALVATQIIAPLGFVGALLYARSYAAEALGYLSTRLVGEPSLATVEHLVRSVLDDPLARLVFWLPVARKFVDRHGRQVKPDASAEDVSWWSLPQDGNPTLAIVHDSVLAEDPELLEAVGVATTLALENRRLHHDLVDTVQALHASQKRLVSAASEERRRLERDLHDGAQQKLVALRIRIDLARNRDPEAAPAFSSALGAIGVDLDDALHDLRSLAHGIFPPLLADEGLDAALREAARRSAAPVSVSIDVPGRLSPECETAVYYCCLEALQNVAKHAGEDAAATLRLCKDQRAVRFSVVDDGSGFVQDRDKGNVGLTNMADRIGAVGGSLTVRSSPGEGTRVEGRIPLASAGFVQDSRVAHPVR